MDTLSSESNQFKGVDLCHATRNTYGSTSPWHIVRDGARLDASCKGKSCHTILSGHYRSNELRGTILATERRGTVVWALSLKSGDPGLKTLSDHSLNLILGVPGSTSQVHL